MASDYCAQMLHGHYQNMYATSCPNLVKRAINEVGYSKKCNCIGRWCFLGRYQRKFMQKLKIGSVVGGDEAGTQ